jgi:hypothetical protein
MDPTWLDEVQGGQNLNILVPWCIAAIPRVPNILMPPTIKAAALWWLNWINAINAKPTAWAGIVAAINAETGAVAPTPTPPPTPVPSKP